jgi:hypothetical protein
MQTHQHGTSNFPGMSSIKLTVNLSTVTIKDSPDTDIHATQRGGAQMITKQDGACLKVTGNAAIFELLVPRGVPVAVTSNRSTITDERADVVQTPATIQQPPSFAAPASLKELTTTPAQSRQEFLNVTKIEGVNQHGTIEIHPARDGSPTIIHHTGAIIDHERTTVDMVNRGTMTIITPRGTEVSIFNGPGAGGVVDKRSQE